MSCGICRDMLYFRRKGKLRRGRFVPSIPGGGENNISSSSDLEGVRPMYVTYSELFQFCMLILGVITLCVTVSNIKKEIAALP